MKLNPLDSRIALRPMKPEEVTPGGIVIPDKAQEKPQRGTVIAHGPGRLMDDGRRSPVSVEIGDEVLFTRYGGNEIEMEGETILIVDESDVLAVLGRREDRERRNKGKETR